MIFMDERHLNIIFCTSVEYICFIYIYIFTFMSGYNMQQLHKIVIKSIEWSLSAVHVLAVLVAYCSTLSKSGDPVGRYSLQNTRYKGMHWQQINLCRYIHMRFLCKTQHNPLRLACAIAPDAACVSRLESNQYHAISITLSTQIIFFATDHNSSCGWDWMLSSLT